MNNSLIIGTRIFVAAAIAMVAISVANGAMGYATFWALCAMALASGIPECEFEIHNKCKSADQDSPTGDGKPPHATGDVPQ